MISLEYFREHTEGARMNALKYLPVLAMLALPTLSHAGDVFVSHFEPLQDMTFHAANESSALSAQKARPAVVDSLRFDAMGRRFDLKLVPNDRLVSSMPASAAYEGIHTYRGKLADDPDSWVRIVMFNGMPRGLVWDGETMFAIEAPGDSAMEITSPVMFRLDDLYIPPGTMSCDALSLSGNAAKVYSRLQSAMLEAVSQAPGAVSEITMGVIGDSLFTNAKGGDAAAAAAITARFNNIDGWYSEQVGIQINVQRIETFDSATDPFDDTLNSSTLLDQVSEYRLQTPAQNNLGLTHLYTGRDFNSTTVGVAWRGTLCEDYFGAGVSEGRVGLLTDSLIAAHEIGHNFGAEHDGDPGGSCPEETGDFIMSPSVSSVQQFSDCSINVMQAVAANASCVVALPAVDVGIRQVSQISTVLLSASTDIEYEISSNGTVGVSGVVADITLPGTLALDNVTTSTGSCSSGAGTVSCTLGDLAGQSDHTITISTTPIAVGTGMVNATVSTTDTDERASNNQDALQLTVDPAVDLVFNTPLTPSVFVNGSTTVTATLQNLSTLAATNVSLSVSLAAGLQADSASWSIGTCTVAAQQVDCQASNFDGQSSSDLSITATALSLGSQSVTASLSSADADADPSNNNASGSVNVVSPDGGNDDESGGGTTNPLLLILLALAGLTGRYYSRSFIR